MKRVIFLTAILTATLLLFGSCGGNGKKSGYTIRVKISSDKTKQELEWNPIKRELSKVSDEMNDFNSVKKVEEAGYRVVSGDFVTGPTYVKFKNSVHYIFEPDMDDVTKGHVAIYIPAARTSYGGKYNLYKSDFPSGSSPLVSVINDCSPSSGQTIGLLNYTKKDGKYRFSTFLSGIFQAFSDYNNREDIDKKIAFEAVNIENSASIKDDIEQVKAAIDDMVKEKKAVAILSAFPDDSGEVASYAAKLNIPFYEISEALDKKSQGPSHFILPSNSILEAAAVSFTANELKPLQIVTYDGFGIREEFLKSEINKYENRSGNTQSIEIKYLPPDQVRSGVSYSIGDDDRRILNINKTPAAVIAFDTTYREGKSFFTTLFKYTGDDTVPVVLASGLNNEKIPEWWRYKNPLYSLSYFNIESKSNPVIKYADKFKNSFRRYPNRGELIGYETANMLIDIITAQENIKPDQVVEATKKGTFTSATGDFGFGKDNISSRSYAVYKYDKKNDKKLYGLISPLGELIK